jgi:WD40 repeat protein
MSLAFSPDGRYLAAGSDFGDIRVWNYSLGTLILDAHAGEDWVTAAAFDDNNRHIALGMGGFFHDTSVQIWELESGFRQWSLLEHSGGVKYLAFSPDGKLLASSDDSGELIIWDAGSGAALKKLSLPAPAIAGLRFSRDGKILQLGAEDGEILSYGVVAEKLK